MHITAGAGHMYCGSCLRDNVLARSLLDAGREVMLVATYTPTKAEGRDVSLDGPADDGAIHAVADANSLKYSLDLGVGDRPRSALAGRACGCG